MDGWWGEREVECVCERWMDGGGRGRSSVCVKERERGGLRDRGEGADIESGGEG